MSSLKSSLNENPNDLIAGGSRKELGLTLALGGGGVKCYAHLGVLEILQKHHWRLKGISATSGSAILASMFACGYSTDEIVAYISTINPAQLSKRTKLDKNAIFGLSNWRPILEQIFEDRHFEDLSVPLSFPAVDFHKNTEVILNTGPIVDALLAAIAIPGLFPPQMIGESTLIDGGIINPVPVSLARSLSPDVPTAAVILNPPIDQWNRHPFPRLMESIPLLRLLSGLRYTRALNNYIQASDLTNRMLAELRLQRESPDWIIRPAVNHLGLFDRVDVQGLIAAGRNAAKNIQGLIDA